MYHSTIASSKLIKKYTSSQNNYDLFDDLKVYSNPEKTFVNEDFVIVINGFTSISKEQIQNQGMQTFKDSCSYLIQHYKNNNSFEDFSLWGRYSIYFVDKKDKKIFVLSDYYGSHSIFYLNSNKHIFISTLLSNFKSLDTENKDFVNKDALLFLIKYGFNPLDETLFKSIKKLDKQTNLIFENKLISHQKLNFKQDTKSLKNKSEDQLVDDLHNIFFESLEDQLPKEKDVAVMLGGFDSALVAAGLVHLGKSVSTYSFKYSNESYNQKNTDKVSKLLKTEHKWLKIADHIVMDEIINYSKTYNTPSVWPNYIIQTKLLSEMIKQDGHQVAFTGDGCDYLFFGYPITYSRLQLISSIAQIPDTILKFLLAVIENLGIDFRFGRSYHALVGAIYSALEDEPIRSYLNFTIVNDKSIKKLFEFNKDDFQKMEEYKEKIISDIKNEDITRLGYMGKKLLAPYLIKMEGSYISTGLNIAAPYLHYKMENFANSLPTEMLRPKDKNKEQDIGKYLLTKMAKKHGLLSDEIIYQPKMGAVDAPVSNWYKSSYSEILKKNINSNFPVSIKSKYVDDMFSNQFFEKLWKKKVAKQTSNVLSTEHILSILLTTASFYPNEK